MPEDQTETIALLADPATHGGEPVEQVGTHSAIVFLAGDRAWKIKRAVRYDYLDFSTAARRKAVLERELALNAPAAPGIYRRVVAITREADGELALDGAGEPVDYALEMRRFPADTQLDRVADAGGLDDGLARALGESIADYHAAAEVRGADGAALIAEILAELGRVFADQGPALGATEIGTFNGAATTQLSRIGSLLSQRTAEGRVRRCHGDLHLRNIVLIEGRPVPFDALEFDERLGTCDVLYDLAFLLMDLDQRGLGRAANLCLNAWLARTRDFTGLAALPLFLAVRAAIRAMVGVQTARATGQPEAVTDARSYLARALQYLAPAPPCLVALGGLSGSGKSTVARHLAPALPPPPGAVHLRSDEVRKALRGVAPLTRLPPDAYAADETARVYDRLLADTRTCLAAGHSVVVDATFLDPAERAALREVARGTGTPLLAVWLTAPPEILLARVTARRDDASDADADVVRRQLARFTGAPDWTEIDATGTAEATARLILGRLPGD